MLRISVWLISTFIYSFACFFLHSSDNFNLPRTLASLQQQFLLYSHVNVANTVINLSFWTDMPGQTVQTQLRLLLEEQSDQGLHCLSFRLHRLDSLLYGKAT